MSGEFLPCPYCGNERLTFSVFGGCLPVTYDADTCERAFSETPYIASATVECEPCHVVMGAYESSKEPRNGLAEAAVDKLRSMWNKRRCHEGTESI